ncbi:hypothetical protein DPMN_158057 [Dreissena polymorpha]|uniref:Uncharacterized protein n=1 Tax=Dreissena polymorpha TaxID=45954 RepID=A0A9D4IPF6_DREPO|nr:hypothetical protein DPMN_158057 [Dreissena polymorpha]
MNDNQSRGYTPPTLHQKAAVWVMSPVFIITGEMVSVNSILSNEIWQKISVT